MAAARQGEGVGQLRISGVLSSEPAGKPLRECAQGERVVTFDAGAEDDQVVQQFGVAGLRRARLLRIATEAHDQGIELTQEGLARILGAGPKTVKRDIAYFRGQGIYVPTRGQQKDLGPLVPHRAEAVRLTLEGRPLEEVTRRILHSPGAVARILYDFRRVVALLRGGSGAEEVARKTGVPRRLIAEYGRLADEAAADPERAERLDLLLGSAEPDPTGTERLAAAEMPLPPRRGAFGERRRSAIFDEQVRVLRRDVFGYVLGLQVRQAARYKVPLALLAVDVPAPERVAGRGRALAGKTLAELLRGGLRRTDVIGRTGLTRYLVLLPFADETATERTLERLHRLPAVPAGQGFVAGAACFPGHGTAAGELLRRCERALVKAYRQGRPYALPPAGPT